SAVLRWLPLEVFPAGHRDHGRRDAVLRLEQRRSGQRYLDLGASCEDREVAPPVGIADDVRATRGAILRGVWTRKRRQILPRQHQNAGTITVPERELPAF